MVRYAMVAGTYCASSINVLCSYSYPALFADRLHTSCLRLCHNGGLPATCKSRVII